MGIAWWLRPILCLFLKIPSIIQLVLLRGVIIKDSSAECDQPHHSFVLFVPGGHSLLPLFFGQLVCFHDST